MMWIEQLQHSIPEFLASEPLAAFGKWIDASEPSREPFVAELYELDTNWMIFVPRLRKTFGDIHVEQNAVIQAPQTALLEALLCKQSLDSRRCSPESYVDWREMMLENGLNQFLTAPISIQGGSRYPFLAYTIGVRCGKSNLDCWTDAGPLHVSSAAIRTNLASLPENIL